MLSLVGNNKGHIYLEETAKNQWRFIYKESLNSLLNRFYDANDAMDIGDYETVFMGTSGKIRPVHSFLLKIVWQNLRK